VCMEPQAVAESLEGWDWSSCALVWPLPVQSDTGLWNPLSSSEAHLGEKEMGSEYPVGRVQMCSSSI